MNCRDWEERIALYLGGDLSPTDAAAVERHLADCVGCQLFSSGLKQSLDLLREAHQEPLAPEHFTAVRARVLAALDGRRRTALGRWAWIGAMAAAAAVLLVMLSIRPVPQPAPLQVATAPPPPVVEPPPAPRPVGVRPHRRVVPRRAATPAPQPAQPMVVKLITDDPDVVIYWITSPKGD